MTYDRTTSAFGHVATSIENSPVNITVSINLNLGENANVTNEQGGLTEVGRTLQILKSILSGGEVRQHRHVGGLADIEARLEQTFK
jgi:hypothetical protein